MMILSFPFMKQNKYEMVWALEKPTGCFVADLISLKTFRNFGRYLYRRLYSSLRIDRFDWVLSTT